jgi:hypothetical protein
MKTVKLYHVWMDTDIDCYDHITLDDPRPIESFENLDIKTINSLYHFFEVVNINSTENAEEIYLYLVDLCAKGDFPTI